jgi:hypothetical protein
VRWAGNVACFGEKRRAYKVVVVKSEGQRRSGKLGVAGTIILKWLLKKYYVSMWTKFT